MRRIATIALALCLYASAAQAAPIYVGSWHVGDGPVWTSNPAVLNALETAALLFGGLPTDYAISTISNDPNLINNMSFVDGWGDSQYLLSPVAENYSLDNGAPGYNDPQNLFQAYSAYVLDHSCFNRYGNPGAACGPNEPGLNYAFRVAAVPEPATILLMGSGLVGVLRRRRRRS